MKLNQTLIAIRPRTIFERLDLAFLLCGRYPLGIFLSLMVGILPFLMLNQWLLADENENYFALFILLILPLELPFSTIPLTLYLGQMTFSRSFSIKEAIVTTFRQLPALLIYQVILRGVLCVLVILMPIVAMGMYHMNEIILLERSSINIAWKRRRVLHDSHFSDILVSRFVEFIFFFIGFMMLTSLIKMISSLWNDQTKLDQLLLFTDSEMYFQEMIFGWQGSLAFFLTIGFLRIYRFVTYLDSRIRYEGWDVELKLRSLAQSYSAVEAT